MLLGERFTCCWVRGSHAASVFQPDSLFNMRRPYDLVALMQQEQRAVMLENLKEELLARKEEIDKNEDKDTGWCSCNFSFFLSFAEEIGGLDSSRRHRHCGTQPLRLYLTRCLTRFGNAFLKNTMRL